MATNGGSSALIPAVNITEKETVERGVASFVAVSLERDALKARVEALDLDLNAREAEIKVLRDMLTFNEGQSKLREAERANVLKSYLMERDLAVTEQVKSETQFEDLFKAMVGVLQAFRANSGELVKKATNAQAQVAK